MNGNRRMDRLARIDRFLKPRHAAMSRLVALVFAAGILATALSPGRAQAQSSIPREETWVTDGGVYAIAPTADTVYIGGKFTYVGPYTGCGVSLDISKGRVQSPFPKVNGCVWACASDGAGGWYIGGEFTRVGNLGRNGIAHILSDGSVDPAWNPNAGGINPVVNALAVSASTVYVAGGFWSIGGQARYGVAALDAATGNATAWNPNSNGIVLAIAVSGSVVYAGGWFTAIGGQSRNFIAALDTGTGNATTWNPNSNAGVFALSLFDSTVYVGGEFTSIGGQYRYYIAALDATTGNATSWNPGAGQGSLYGVGIYALAVSGSTLYAGGIFNTIGGEARRGVAALDAATGNATAWNPNADLHVYALAVSGSTVYVGGDFTSIGGQPRNYIAALDVTSGNATDWNPNANCSYLLGLNGVNALAVSGSAVYAGGSFTSINGQSRSNIAALDATTGNATDWIPDPDSGVGALAVSGSTVYVGGGFTAIGGKPRNYIAALDGTTGNATDWNPNANGWVLALAVSGSMVYAGGEFNSIGGQLRNSIAALDTATGNATAWDPNPNASGGAYPDVYALAVSGSTVYAGGLFTSIGGQSRNYIAALDASTGHATPWNPNPADPNLGHPYIHALAVSGATVYAGGRFTFIGGQSRKRIAALDAVTGNATPWDPNATGGNYVRALAVFGSTIYVGGDFTTIRGELRPYFAQFDTPPAAAARMWPLY